MAGTLYVVATPIGNLEDISRRAARTLGEVELIACEDTRRTRVLLNHLQLSTPAESYHRFSERRKLDRFLEWLRSGKSLALVSDAGTPTLSDPGAILVSACRQESIRVIAIPGASALLTALACSSFAGRPFHFHGFLPPKSRQRRQELQKLASETATLVFYESPERIAASLEDMLAVLGDRQAAAGREMTKMFEEIVEGRISDLSERWKHQRPLGEFTLLVGGRPEVMEQVDPEVALEQVRELLRLEKLPKREACRRVAARLGLTVRDLYQGLIRSNADKKRSEPHE
jgi:16S rRNA (cytidine1402-2'-O)-methyltransferase